jgi:hypothetical protein
LASPRTAQRAALRSGPSKALRAAASRAAGSRAAALLAAALLALPVSPAASPRGGDARDEARSLAAAGKWQEAAETLQVYLRSAIGDWEVHDLLGQALLKLGRRDEAAYAFQTALERLDAGGEGERLASQLARQLQKADPLTQRREAFLRKSARTLREVGEELDDRGHRERALEVLERIRPLAAGDAGELARVDARIAAIRATTTEVSLDEATIAERPPGGWPLLQLESAHYDLRANLEPQVAQRVADVMDDIFASYIQIYFDGDAKRVSARKARIRIWPTHEDMLSVWSGPSTPGGWWSPGDWEVTCYDTRTDTGSLDPMLQTLFHEASHQFMSMLGEGAPAWINEGTASFFEGAKAMADHRVLWPDAARDRLGTLREFLAHDRPPSVADVVGYGGPGSYPGEYYAFGWGLVYFLQQFEDPRTLEYVYRPMYARYRDLTIQRGSDPRKLFDEVFIGPKPPLFASFGAFEQLWKSWIQEEVWPLHFGPEVRQRRERLVERYIAAADAARGKSRSPVSEQELCLRALGHVEFIRTRLDPPETPDPALIARQADLLERVGRAASAAPLLEELLRLAAEETYPISQAEYEALEQRLSRIDRKNAPLRLARTRAQNLAVPARRLLAEYEAAKPPMLLRAYSFAKLAGLALQDQGGLLASAERLRDVARAADLLRGALYPLAGSSWKTLFTNPEIAFERGEERVAIEGTRYVGRICTDVPLSGEYEIRARFLRVGETSRSTFHGVVVSGTEDADWMVIGFDWKGRLGLKWITVAGGGTSDKAIAWSDLSAPLQPGEPLELAVRVFPDGRILVRAGEREPVEFQAPLALPSKGFAGIYAKDGRTVLENALVEVFP